MLELHARWEEMHLFCACSQSAGSREVCPTHNFGLFWLLTGRYQEASEIRVAPGDHQAGLGHLRTSKVTAGCITDFGQRGEWPWPVDSGLSRVCSARERQFLRHARRKRRPGAVVNES